MSDLRIRDARPEDAPAIAHLIRELGYDVTAADVSERLLGLRELGHAVLVAELEALVGVLTTSRMQVLHRPRPVGRISMLVVSEKVRSRGIGAMLVETAEQRLREQGCGLVEVTSNLRRERAHAFYLRLGYERTSARFAKALV